MRKTPRTREAKKPRQEAPLEKEDRTSETYRKIQQESEVRYAELVAGLHPRQRALWGLD